jgi:3-dehydroquinate synthase
MVDLRVSDPMIIQSHKGPYAAIMDEKAFQQLESEISPEQHFVIDKRVADLYSTQLARVLVSPSVLLLEAAESSKSLDKFPSYVEHLVSRKIRRDHVLVAIGGGVIQDIVCFLAATLLRGIQWHFYPTTLLAQADSCIGSKSSINVGKIKNILGTFTPPARIRITTRVLETLDPRDVRSGIGEMLKVHAIESPESFERIAADYPRLQNDSELMQQYILRSLEIKKQFIEQDEFDRGIRNIMNYGHTFGHAIESATDFAVPHGIGVTIGMDMANYISMRFGLAGIEHYRRMHPILAANYNGFEKIEIPIDAFISAISKDKKNIASNLRLILPDAAGRVSPVTRPNDATFRAFCEEYLSKLPCE